MKYNKNNNKEIMIKFKETTQAKELDEMIYHFEEEMNNINNTYFLKESENPFIFLLEYPKPEELIKQLHNEEYELIPVICAPNNTNHITSTILRKIKHKVLYDDTLKVDCHLNTYLLSKTEDEITDEITRRIKTTTGLKTAEHDPVWNIEIFIIGDISAINITKNNQNKLNT